MDFFNPDDVRRFFEMDKGERREAVEDWLATVAEPWQGDSDEDKLARSMVAAMNAYMQAAFAIESDDFKKVNRHVMGLWLHGYTQMAKNFQTLAALSAIKKSFEGGD